MSFLAKFRVLTKVLTIICVLSLVTAVMAWLGISSLHSVSERSDTMARSAARALLATRANNNVVAMNRAEFRSALDPRDENRLAARAVIDEQVKQLEERLAEVSKTVDEKTQALLPAVRSALSAYQSQMKQTLQSVDDAKSSELTQSAAGLREVAMKSRAAAETLQIAIRAVATRLDQRVMENNKAAEEEYASASRLLMILAVGSVVFGLGFGFAVGQYGIAKPIRAVVELLQQLAGGKYDIDISGTERGDEVGDVAKTALVFKENGLARIRMEREQKEAEVRAAAQRRTDMLQLADGFERAVGEIVETVSSASTELEASADTLTSTAERSQKLTTVVAAASEEASTNVQSVASATEELSSSEEQGAATQEISRNVQQASMGTQQVSSNITDVQRGASETGSASAQVLSAAQSLSGDSTRLKLEVGKFLNSVRAA